MKNTLWRVSVEIAVFLGISIIALEFIDDRLYAYIAGGFGYALAITAGEIVILINGED